MLHLAVSLTKNLLDSILYATDAKYDYLLAIWPKTHTPIEAPNQDAVWSAYGFHFESHTQLFCINKWNNFQFSNNIQFLFKLLVHAIAFVLRCRRVWR